MGFVVFTLASIALSLDPFYGSSGAMWLIGWRLIQALGGSMLMSNSAAILTDAFPAEQRGFALGTNQVAGISGQFIGLVAGGLLAAIDWRAVFWVNVPIGLAAIFLTHKFVPESKAPHPRRLDPVGQVLMILTLGLLVFGIIEAPNHGWGSDLILGCFAGAILAGALLIFFEARHPEPLIDLRFFRSPPFSGAAIVSVCAFVSLGGFLFLNTLFLQDVRGYSALHAGVALIPMAALMMVFSPISGRLVGKRGPRLSLVLGGIVILWAEARQRESKVVPATNSRFQPRPSVTSPSQ